MLFPSYVALWPATSTLYCEKGRSCVISKQSTAKGTLSRWLWESLIFKSFQVMAKPTRFAVFHLCWGMLFLSHWKETLVEVTFFCSITGPAVGPGVGTGKRARVCWVSRTPFNSHTYYIDASFTGKYTVRKTHIRLHPGPEWHIFHYIDDVISRRALVYTIKSKKKITRRLEECMNFIFPWWK